MRQRFVVCYWANVPASVNKPYNSAIDSDTHSAPLRAPISARHCGR
jgi:hypothetical protein